MGLKLEENIEEKITPKVIDLGYEVEYVEFVKEGDSHILRVVLDKPGEIVDIEGCEMVSRQIEEDVDSLITKEYVLEVASPGVERQLKNIKLYSKYIGSKIFIKLYHKIEYGKELVGMLNAVNEQTQEITLVMEQEKEVTVVIALKDITSAHTVYDFDAVFKTKKTVNLNKLNKFNRK